MALATLPRTRVQRIHRFDAVAAFSQRRSKNLIDVGLDKPVLSLILRFAGQITAAGGGGIATLTCDAPIEFVCNRLRLRGAHRTLGGAAIIPDVHPRPLYWWGSLWTGKRQLLTAPTPGAGASGNFNATIIIPMSLPGVPMYLDPRDYSQLTLEIDHGAATDYAASNVNAVASFTCDVLAEAMIEGEPPVGAPHLEPYYNYGTRALDQASVLIDGGAYGGMRLARRLWVTHDDSATGDAERVDGLLRNARIRQNARDLLDSTWFALREKSAEQFPLTQETASPAGVACWQPGEGFDVAEWPNIGVNAAVDLYDNATTPEQDVTAITPATGDLVHALAFGGLGVYGFDHAFAAAVGAAGAAV